MNNYTKTMDWDQTARVFRAALKGRTSDYSRRAAVAELADIFCTDERCFDPGCHCEDADDCACAAEDSIVSHDPRCSVWRLGHRIADGMSAPRPALRGKGPGKPKAEEF